MAPNTSNPATETKRILVREQSYLTDAPRHFRLENAPAVLRKIESVGHFSATRLSRDTAGLGMTEPIPPEQTFVLVWQLRDCPTSALWLDGKEVKNPVHRKNTIEFYDLECETKAYIESPLDSLHLCIPKQSIAKIAEEDGLAAPKSLSRRLGDSIEDPVVPLLAKFLIPMLERPRDVDTLSLDHVAVSVMAYVARAYGHKTAPARKPVGVLAPWQLRTAEELLSANLDGRITLAEIAAACHLPTAHFARSFTRSTGLTPQRWLLARRADVAKKLLRETKISLSEVAVACGFSDQSHLTRVFLRCVGITPGAYRKSL